MTLQRIESVGYLVNWAARLFAKRIDEVLKPQGVFSAYLPVLFALSSGESMTQKALASAAAIEQPTMAVTLDRMKRDNFVQSEPDPADRRAMRYSLTEKAKGLLPEVKAAVQAVNDRALTQTSQDKMNEIKDILQKMISSLT